jgi:hypothetical protein
MSESGNKTFFGNLVEKIPAPYLLILAGAVFIFLGASLTFVSKLDLFHVKVDLDERPVRERAIAIPVCAGGLLMIIGVFFVLRERPTEIDAKEIERYDVKITSPKEHTTVRVNFRIEGSFKKLPEGLEMAILERHGSHYWRRCGVDIKRKEKTWISDSISVVKDFPLPKEKSQKTDFIVVVMTTRGRVIYNYHEKVVKQTTRVREMVPSQNLEILGWEGWPSGMCQCAETSLREQV